MLTKIKSKTKSEMTANHATINCNVGLPPLSSQIPQNKVKPNAIIAIEPSRLVR